MVYSGLVASFTFATVTKQLVIFLKGCLKITKSPRFII
jgi:hypothetical protein